MLLLLKLELDLLLVILVVCKEPVDRIELALLELVLNEPMDIPLVPLVLLPLLKTEISFRLLAFIRLEGELYGCKVFSSEISSMFRFLLELFKENEASSSSSWLDELLKLFEKLEFDFDEDINESNILAA